MLERAEKLLERIEKLLPYLFGTSLILLVVVALLIWVELIRLLGQ